MRNKTSPITRSRNNQRFPTTAQTDHTDQQLRGSVRVFAFVHVCYIVVHIPTWKEHGMNLITYYSHRKIKMNIHSSYNLSSHKMNEPTPLF